MNFYEKAIDNLNWVEVTLWYIEASFNHLELGHSDKSEPIGNPAWKGQKWSKRIWYAENGRPIKVLN